MTSGAFFLYWLSFTLLILITGAFAVYWAFRAGHFKDQERARYLALWAEIPEEPQVKNKNITTGPDKSGHTDEHG